MKITKLSCSPVLVLVATSLLLSTATRSLAVPVTYVIEDLTGLDTSLVRNDGILAALNAGSLTGHTVNSVDFTGITVDAGGGGHIDNTVDGSTYTLTYSGDINDASYGADARNRYNYYGVMNENNEADWGECPPGSNFLTCNTSGIMEQAVRTVSGVEDDADPNVSIDIQASGLTIGTTYRMQFLMDVADEHREMEIIHDGQGTGGLLVGTVTAIGQELVENGISVLATFTADATSVDFAIHAFSHSRAVINAFSLAEVEATGLAGDFDTDGDVDGSDFLQWQRDQVGNLSDWQNAYPTSGTSLSVATSVPEPGTLALVAMLFASLGAGRLRRS